MTERTMIGKDMLQCRPQRLVRFFWNNCNIALVGGQSPDISALDRVSCEAGSAW
jgi:hypothetical protein